MEPTNPSPAPGPNENPQPEQPVVNPQFQASQTDVTPPVEPMAPLESTAAAPTQPTVTGPSTPMVTNTIANGTPSPTAMFAGGPPPAIAKSGRKKKLLVVATAAVALLLIGGGSVFAWYLPNQPANVWKRGLSRTGEAVDTLVTNATSEDTQAKYKSDAIDGNVKFDSKAFKATLTVKGNTSTRANQLDLDLKLDQSGQTARALSIKFLSNIPEGKKYPNLYFQLNGLGKLGIDQFLSGGSQYDGKWIYVSGDYIKQLAEQVTDTTEQTNITVADVNAYAKSMSGLARQYVFTSDEQKGILENRAYLGKETIDGVKTSHFTVGLNKAHVKQFCTALADTTFNSELAKHAVGDAKARDNAKADFVKSCQKSADEIKQSDTFDAWIGGKYGMIRQVRFTDEKNKKDYVVIGQKYNGGDEISLYSDLHMDSQKTDVHVSVKDNAKTGAITLDANGKSTGDFSYTFTAHFSATPTATPPKVTEPTDKIDLQQLIQKAQTQYSF